MGRRLTVALLAAGLLAAPAHAQQIGGMEFGIIGKYTLFDHNLQLDDAVGFGGRVGVFVAQKWMIELGYSTTPADGSGVPSDLKYEPFHVRVNFVEPFSSRGQMVVGLGYVFNYWGPLATADDGPTGLFGLRFDVNGPWFVRVDATADLIPAPLIRSDDVWNIGFQAGVGVRVGGDRR